MSSADPFRPDGLADFGADRLGFYKATNAMRQAPDSRRAGWT